MIYEFDKRSIAGDDELAFWRSGTGALLASVILIEVMVLGVINFTTA